MNVEQMTPAERLALWDTHDRPEGWNAGNEHHLADLIISDMRALSSSPADDVREALAAVLDDSLLCWAYNGTHTVFHPMMGADAVLARFEVRPYGPSSPPADDVQCGYTPGDDLRCIQAAGHGGLGHMVSELATAAAARERIAPPADDVREALASRLESSFGSFLAQWPHDPDRFFGGAADEVMSMFEVRPIGIITDAVVEAAYEAFVAGPVDARASMRAALKAAGEVRPYGKVTDAEVEWEYGVRHVAVDGWPTDRAHVSLDAARGDLETCGMNCHLIRRRAAQEAGKWEPVEAAREARS